MNSNLGQRQTRQREQILKVLAEARGPLTARQILDRASTGSQAIGIATVYRTINLLLEARQLASVVLPNGETRYEAADLGHHDHFECRACKNVFDLDVCPLHLAPGTIVPGGYVVEDHSMTLFGLCPDCAARESKSRKGKPRARQLTKREKTAPHSCKK